MPRAHIEGAKSSREDNIIYTQKDNKYKQNFKEEIYIEEIHSDLEQVRVLMDKYEFPKGDRKINCVIDPIGGKGKTEFCRWAVMNYKDIIITGGKSADMKNQIAEYKKYNDCCPKYILIDCPRSMVDYLSYTGIEEVKNMLFYSGKYEGKMIVGNKPFVCLFMNEEPDINNMSLDRWNLIYI